MVEILAAPEKLIEAVASDPQLFARAAYHLGNRHVPVQIVAESGGGRLRFQADHVLAEMVRGLGCPVIETEAPFQPEAGAYGAAIIAARALNDDNGRIPEARPASRP